MIGVASPGPSVLAVMGKATAQGRTRALALAAGIVSGSLCWGLSAAFGLAGALHLTNPKAIVVWLSVVSPALPRDSGQADALAFVASCAFLGAAIFTCHAPAFSAAAARRGYRAAERGVNALLAGVFAYAGVRMLLSSQVR